VKNIKMSVSDDGKLTIVVNLREEHGESKSQKNIIIASTGGNIPAPEPFEDVRFGVNVYRPKP